MTHISKPARNRFNHGTLPDDVMQNGICKPRPGTKGERMWQLIDSLGTPAQPPERFIVMEAMHNRNQICDPSDKFPTHSMSLKYHHWRTFNGVDGARSKFHKKRQHDDSGDKIKLLKEIQQPTSKINIQAELDTKNMKDETPINLEKLKRLYGKNKAAKKLLDYLARRKNNVNQTTVARLESELSSDGVTRAQIFEILKELTKLHYGELKIGRKGQVSRMIWAVGIVSLGQAASGQCNTVNKILPDDDEEEETKAPKEKPADHRLMSVTYRLRVDLVTEFVLPENLTQKEANRLADFIKSQPFGENH